MCVQILSAAEALEMVVGIFVMLALLVATTLPLLAALFFSRAYEVMLMLGWLFRNFWLKMALPIVILACVSFWILGLMGRSDMLWLTLVGGAACLAGYAAGVGFTAAAAVAATIDSQRGAAIPSEPSRAWLGRSMSECPRVYRRVAAFYKTSPAEVRSRLGLSGESSEPSTG